MMNFKAADSTGVGINYILVVIGWIQVVPLLIDLFENAVLLLISYNHKLMTHNEKLFKYYTLLVPVKWCIALIGFFIAFFSLLLSWLSNEYPMETIAHINIVLLCIAGYLALLIVITLLRRLFQLENNAV
jgi:uncharacterized membrane protein